MGTQAIPAKRRSAFVTFTCYKREALLVTTEAKHLVERALEQARRQYGFWVSGYVIMPDHVHLLVSEPERATLATALQALRQSVARRLICGGEHFWQAQYYDFNVYTRKKRLGEAQLHALEPSEARFGE